MEPGEPKNWPQKTDSTENSVNLQTKLDRITEDFLVNMRSFRNSMEESLRSLDPEKQKELLNQVRTFVMESPYLDKRSDQYLFTIASKQRAFGFLEDAEETIKGAAEDMFQKIYELLMLSDVYIKNGELKKAEKALQEAEKSLPENMETSLTILDLGFMGDADVDGSKEEIEKRKGRLKTEKEKSENQKKSQ